MSRGYKPGRPKAHVYDINKTAQIPSSVADKKKNKNDFYRFLLA